MATGAEMKIIISAQDQASGVLGGIHRLLGGLGSAATSPIRAIGGLTNALGSIGLAAMGIKAVTGAVVGLATGMVSGNAEFERYEVQFGVLLKSTTMAKDRLAELTTFAAKTPFELPEVVRADKVLTAFGLDSETTAKKFGVSGAQIRTTIGDIASGTGANFEELSVTFGKFASGATGEAIARFQELGITTREEMTSWGLQFSKSGELLTPATEAFTVLEANVRKKFGGMMDAQSSTFEGMVSNLQDWLGQTKRALMAPVFDVLKDNLKGLLDFLGSSSAKAALESIGKRLASGVGTAVGALKRMASVIGDIVGYLGEGNKRDLMREWFGDLGPRVDEVVRFIKRIPTELGLIVAGAQNAFAGIRRAFELGSWGGVAKFIGDGLRTEWGKINWGSVWTTVTQTAERVATWFTGAAGAVVTFLKGVWAGINWGSVWTTVTQTVKTVGAWFGGVAGSIITWLQGVWKSINWGATWTAVTLAVSQVGAWFGGVGSAIIGWLKGIWTGINWGATWTAITLAASTVGAWFGGVGAAIKDTLTGVWASIDWKGIWKAVALTATDVGNWFAGGADAVADWLRGIWRGIPWDDVWKGANVAIDSLKVSVTDLIVAAANVKFGFNVADDPEAQAKLAAYYKEVQRKAAEDATRLGGAAGAGLGPAIWAGLIGTMPKPGTGPSLFGPTIYFAIEELKTLLVVPPNLLGGFLKNAFVDPAVNLVNSIGPAIAPGLDLAGRNLSLFWNDVTVWTTQAGWKISTALFNLEQDIRGIGPAIEATWNSIGPAIGDAWTLANQWLAVWGVGMRIWAREQMAPIQWVIDKFNELANVIAGAVGLAPKVNPLIPDFGPVPGEAAGGPVRAGMPYLVGEKGKELFVPTTAGSIIPNGAFGTAAGGAGPNVDPWKAGVGYPQSMRVGVADILTLTTQSLGSFRTAIDAATSALRGVLGTAATVSAAAIGAMSTAASTAAARWNLDPYVAGQGYPASMRRPADNANIDPWQPGGGYPASMRRPSPDAGYMPPAWTPAPTTDPRLVDALEKIAAGDQTQDYDRMARAYRAGIEGMKVIVTVNGQNVMGEIRALGLGTA